MIYKNTNELFSFLKDYYLENGGSVDISTYGMYLGISKGKDWSEIFYNPVREFINVVDKKDLRMALGIPSMIECRPNCSDCKNRYNETMARHVDTIHKLDLNVQCHSNLHLKMYRIGDLVVSGGINLSASDFVDASFIINDTAQKSFLTDIFNDTWQQGNGLKAESFMVG